MRLKKSKTNRGFRLIQFVDQYGKACSLQKSSLATDDCIWFGMDEIPPVHMGQQLSPRMHLDRKAVKKLISILQHFADTGELP